MKQNIGQMIEFLGDDLESIEREDLLTGGAKGGWMVKSEENFILVVNSLLLCGKQ